MNSDLEGSIDRFSELPYKKGSLSKKNWGHPIQSLCSYPSKVKPAIAHTLIDLFTSEGDTVLDPFSGSGTIPFEACNSGRIGIANDLSPFAYNLSQAKVAVPEYSEVKALIDDLERYINVHVNNGVDTNIDAEIIDFYHLVTLKEIILAKQFLLSKSKYPRNAVSFVWSSIAHILHGNRPYALSRRSHNIIPIPPKGPVVYHSLINSLNDKIERAYSLPLDRDYKEGSAYCADAGNMPFSNSKIDVIITSPPFFGTTEFLRQNRVRLWFAGWDIPFQKGQRDKFLEHSPTLSPYRSLLKEFRRVLRKNGLLIMHLGVVKEVDMAKSILPFALDCGFRNHGIVYENVADLENHGRTDRGGTHKHQFLFMTKI